MPKPYLLNEEVLTIKDGMFTSVHAMLGKGAAEYIEDNREGFPDSIAAAWASFPDGSRVIIIAYPTSKAASAAKQFVYDNTPTSSMISTPWDIRYTRSDNKQRGLITSIENYLIAVEGTTKELVNSRFDAVPAFFKNPKPNFVKTVSDEYAWWALAVFIAYMLMQLFIWPRLASWAARIDASPHVAPVSADGLKEKLMAINKHDVPFEIKQSKRPDEVIAEWKYIDSKWVGLMYAGGLKALYRLRLRIDNDEHRVRAQEMSSTISWNIGAASPVIGSFSWSYFKGINFYQYDSGAAYGILFKDGTLKFDHAYKYRFVTSEIKNPIIDIITDSGWDYVPVLTFLKILN